MSKIDLRDELELAMKAVRAKNAAEVERIVRLLHREYCEPHAVDSPCPRSELKKIGGRLVNA
jgi:hypothetical protein